MTERLSRRTFARLLGAGAVSTAAALPSLAVDSTPHREARQNWICAVRL